MLYNVLFAYWSIVSMTDRWTVADVIGEEGFEELVREHHRRNGESGYQVMVALAGKVICGTIDTPVSDGLCLLVAYLPEEGVTLAQVAIESKHNEITAAPALLRSAYICNKVSSEMLCTPKGRFRSRLAGRAANIFGP